MTSLQRIGSYLLFTVSGCLLQTSFAFSQTAPPAGTTSQQAVVHPDGQHDFDFELGSWKIHLKRLLHPLTGSNTWVEFDGTSVTRKVWVGALNWSSSRPMAHPATSKASPSGSTTPNRTSGVSTGAPPDGDARASGNGGRIQRRSRRALRSGTVQRQNDLCPIPLVEHHAEFGPLRTVILRRWRQNLGSELDHRPDAGQRRNCQTAVSQDGPAGRDLLKHASRELDTIPLSARSVES